MVRCMQTSRRSRPKTPSEEYVVRAICAHRNGSRGLEYKVLWENYSDSEATWELEKNLENAGDVLNPYKEENGLMDESEQSSPATESDKSSDDGNRGTIDSDGDNYEVEAIVDHKIRDKKIIYIVSWVGYPGERSEATEEDLSGAIDILNAYKKAHKLDKKEEKNGGERKSMTAATPTARSTRSSATTTPTPRSTRTSAAANSHAKRIGNLSGSSDEEAIPTRKTLKRRAKESPAKSTGRNTRSAKKSIIIEVHSPASTPTPRSTKAAAAANGTAKRGRELSDSPVPKKKAAKKDNSPKAASRRPSLWLGKSPSRSESSESKEALPVLPVRPRADSDGMIIAADPNCGLFNGLVVDRVSHVKFHNGVVSVQVTYETPVPSEYKRAERIGTKFVRHFAPQKLIDHYEQILHPDH